MAQRRMFSLKIVDTDSFVDMPAGARLLYYDLAMRADDDGFVSNPKKIMRMTNSSEDDFKVLIAKQFIIPFDSGICVISDWKIHNYIQADRYQETIYLEEKAQIKEKNGMYTKCIQNVYTGKDRLELGKVRLGKDSLVENTIKQKTEDFISEVKTIIGEKEVNQKDVMNFCSYWTEPNKSRTKLRWELQPTFEIKRRLMTWFSNNKNFNKSKIIDIGE